MNEKLQKSSTFNWARVSYVLVRLNFDLSTVSRGGGQRGAVRWLQDLVLDEVVMWVWVEGWVATVLYSFRGDKSTDWTCVAVSSYSIDQFVRTSLKSWKVCLYMSLLFPVAVLHRMAVLS
jgi:hypothetical protein